MENVQVHGLEAVVSGDSKAHRDRLEDLFWEECVDGGGDIHETGIVLELLTNEQIEQLIVRTAQAMKVRGAEDMRDVVTGASLCERHVNAAKLQSLMQLYTTIHFAHKDEMGDFRPKTLAEAKQC